MKIKLRIQTIYEPHPSKCRDLAVWDRFALIRELRNHRDGPILVPLDCYLGMALEEATVGKADSRHNIRIGFGATVILRNQIWRPGKILMAVIAIPARIQIDHTTILIQNTEDATSSKMQFTRIQLGLKFLAECRHPI